MYTFFCVLRSSSHCLYVTYMYIRTSFAGLVITSDALQTFIETILQFFVLGVLTVHMLIQHPKYGLTATHQTKKQSILRSTDTDPGTNRSTVLWSVVVVLNALIETFSANNENHQQQLHIHLTRRFTVY